jgi:hypothetical protein
MMLEQPNYGKILTGSRGSARIADDSTKKQTTAGVERRRRWLPEPCKTDWKAFVATRIAANQMTSSFGVGAANVDVAAYPASEAPYSMNWLVRTRLTQRQRRQRRLLRLSGPKRERHSSNIHYCCTKNADDRAEILPPSWQCRWHRRDRNFRPVSPNEFGNYLRPRLHTSKRDMPWPGRA